jgi:hypothetical protein
MTLYCPIHGPILEEEQVNSSGGKFCSAYVNDTDEACFQPLELNTDANISQ